MVKLTGRGLVVKRFWVLSMAEALGETGRFLSTAKSAGGGGLFPSSSEVLSRTCRFRSLVVVEGSRQGEIPSTPIQCSPFYWEPKMHRKKM